MGWGGARVPPVVGGSRGVALDRETMADDRTIAPGPARWRRAWQAGMRPRSRWLWPAVACAVVALALDGGPPPAETWSLDLRPGGLTPERWWPALLDHLGLVWLGAGALVLLVALLGRRLGVVSTPARRRLGAASVERSVLGPQVIAVVVAMGLGGALVGVLAGAARSADASEAGLWVLWWGWAAKGFASCAVGLLAAAVAELALDRRQRESALRLSSQQVRDRARAAGGR